MQDEEYFLLIPFCLFYKKLYVEQLNLTSDQVISWVKLSWVKELVYSFYLLNVLIIKS